MTFPKDILPSQRISLFDMYNPERTRQIAIPGEYQRRILKSPFAGDGLLLLAAPYVERGLFQEGVHATERELRKRNIKMKIAKPGQHWARGTERRGKKEALLLNADYSTNHPIRQLFDLLHRNMSLVLQRMGTREDRHYLRMLLEMDIAYYEAVRLGLISHPQSTERTDAESMTYYLEANTRRKLRTLGA